MKEKFTLCIHNVTRKFKIRIHIYKFLNFFRKKAILTCLYFQQKYTSFFLYNINSSAFTEQFLLHWKKYKPSSISGGKPPTNTFLENLSPVSLPGDLGGHRREEFKDGTICSKWPSSNKWLSSNPVKNGDLPMQRKKYIHESTEINIG